MWELPSLRPHIIRACSVQYNTITHNILNNGTRKNLFWVSSIYSYSVGKMEMKESITAQSRKYALQWIMQAYQQKKNRSLSIPRQYHIFPITSDNERITTIFNSFSAFTGTIAQIKKKTPKKEWTALAYIESSEIATHITGRDNKLPNNIAGNELNKDCLSHEHTLGFVPNLVYELSNTHTRACTFSIIFVLLFVAWYFFFYSLIVGIVPIHLDSTTPFSPTPFICA